MNDSKPPITFSYGILKVKVLNFAINEAIYIADPSKELSVEIAQLFGTNNEENIVDLRLRLYYFYPESKEQIAAEITVQNHFKVDNLGSYFKDGEYNLPTQLLLSIISISVSHARALFSHNLAGTLYADYLLPIVNPVEMGKKFFPSMTGENNTLNDYTRLINFNQKM